MASDVIASKGSKEPLQPNWEDILKTTWFVLVLWPLANGFGQKSCQTFKNKAAKTKYWKYFTYKKKFEYLLK